MKNWPGAIVLALMLLVVNITSASAWNPTEVLNNPVLEERARAISSELRCLVCQNQSIDDSDAELAKDLRILVRERLTAGDTDSEVFDFLVARYGEFILLKPRFGGSTVVLWLFPIFLLALGGFIIFAKTKKPKEIKILNELNASENRRLAEIIERQ
jgi:cytochrome c-type biogenesis protein CcmH